MIVNRNIQFKLPMLVRTRFEDTNLDCLQFWNQFYTEIEKFEISAISKFSYLKEFLIPKVRALIDNLPFTPEMYARANSILWAKFRKPSQLAVAHIQCITSLAFFSNSYPNKIIKFYEKLFAIVQAVDTMNKLKDIKVYERLSLDKLSEIIVDFFRLDDKWRELDFLKLAESLHNWTDCNLKTIHKSEKHEKYKRENIF